VRVVTSNDTFEPQPSLMAAIMPAGDDEPTVEQARERLSSTDAFEVRECSADPAAHEQGMTWKQSATVRLADRTEPLTFEFCLAPTPAAPPLHGTRWVSHEEVEAVCRGGHCLMTMATYGVEPRRDFHRQIRLTSLLAPKARVLIDVESTAVFPGDWMRDVATCSLPPSPTSCFQIQAVAAPGQDGAWLHTHGLARFGLAELEIVDVGYRQLSAMGTLLECVASWMLDAGQPAAGEPFMAVHGAELVWLPWQEALAHVPKGDWCPEEGRTEEHQGASAVLLTPPAGFLKKRYGSPTRYARLLDGGAVHLVSSQETERAATVARERFERFAALQRRFGSTDNGWVFDVKLGLPVDGATGPTEREHLWFEVHAITEGGIDATLRNEPYDISGLHEGDRGVYPLDVLSDFTVRRGDDGYTAETLFLLERALAAE